MGGGHLVLARGGVREAGTSRFGGNGPIADIPGLQNRGDELVSEEFRLNVGVLTDYFPVWSKSGFKWRGKGWSAALPLLDQAILPPEP